MAIWEAILDYRRRRMRRREEEEKKREEEERGVKEDALPGEKPI